MKRRFVQGEKIIIVHEPADKSLGIGDVFTVAGYCSGCGNVLVAETPFHLAEDHFEKYKSSGKQDSAPVPEDMMPVTDVLVMLHDLATTPMFYSRNGVIPVNAFQDKFFSVVQKAGLEERFMKYIK
jgi:hypothetical protein